MAPHALTLWPQAAGVVRLLWSERVPPAQLPELDLPALPPLANYFQLS